ncbi:uncharacterized protein [Acropora muricata]|uniref:uncharacterized protein n=1 Tax=Acropora muricata TaxID=159855 RepID=UPI0034E3F64A
MQLPSLISSENLMESRLGELGLQSIDVGSAGHACVRLRFFRHVINLAGGFALLIGRHREHDTSDDTDSSITDSESNSEDDKTALSSSDSEIDDTEANSTQAELSDNSSPG